MTYLANISIADRASDKPAHVSHFGLLKAGATEPVFKGNFPGTTLDPIEWQKTTLNSATVTVASGMAEMACGTNSAGSCKLMSRRTGRFEAGQVTVFQSGVRPGTGLANNIRIWGLMDEDEQEGLYFKWNGTTFQVVARKAGTETAVDSADFSDEPGWEPSDNNNTFRIEYSAGRAMFYRASDADKSLLHVMTNNQEPLVNELDIGVYYENTNSGNTTDESMYVRGSSSSIFGTQVRYNSGGALITSDFDTEVALASVTKYSINTKFGRNPDVDTATTPEDLWNGGGEYTGFNATANENIEVFSSDVDDQGQVLSSGTLTGGSKLTAIDSGATFITDGVAVGDLFINDTTASHGVIGSVDSETQITVYRMIGNHPLLIQSNVSGDTYRIANANDTGAAVVRLDSLLDEDYAAQSSKYVVLNGTTGVTVTGNYMRCPRARIILSGSSGWNEGTITVRQATTTANVFCVMPATLNQTTIGAFTIPAGKVGILKRVRVGLVRAIGS